MRFAPQAGHPGDSRREHIEQVLPVRVLPLDLRELPCPAPMLDVLFSLNGVSWFVMLLEVHEVLYVISLGEAGDCPFPVFKYPTDEVVGDANVEGAVFLTGHDVNEVRH